MVEYFFFPMHPPRATRTFEKALVRFQKELKRVQDLYVRIK